MANNDENRALFKNDEELFRIERNKLGALTLLRGKDNMASGYESYEDKVKTYVASLVWNQTLHPDLYHKKKRFEEFNTEHKFGFKTYEVFDGNAINERQRILFKLMKLMWL